VGPSHDPTLNPTVPAPLPVWPDVIEIHDALLCADHGQPAAVLTLTVPDPPLAPTVWLPGEIDVVHP
jgi:hypothetical protein